MIPPSQPRNVSLTMRQPRVEFCVARATPGGAEESVADGLVRTVRATLYGSAR
jgi:hypothetical protein